MSQQNDRDATNQTLHLIFQQLQRGNLPTAPANLDTKLEQDPYREVPTELPEAAAMGPAPEATPPVGGPSGTDATWPPLEDPTKGTGKGKDESYQRPAPY